MQCPPSNILQPLSELGAWPVKQLTDGDGTLWAIELEDCPLLLIEVIGYRFGERNVTKCIAPWLEKFKERCRALRKLDEQVVVKASFRTGTRRCEFLALSWEHIPAQHPLWLEINFAWLAYDWYTPIQLLGPTEEEE